MAQLALVAPGVMPARAEGTQAVVICTADGLVTLAEHPAAPVQDEQSADLCPWALHKVAHTLVGAAALPAHHSAVLPIVAPAERPGLSTRAPVRRPRIRGPPLHL